MNQKLYHKTFSYFTIAFSLFALVFAYSLERFGFPPCRLCLYQRIVYYLILSCGTIMLVLVHMDILKYRSFFLSIICILIISGIALSVFQVLVEYKIIKYESTCTASFDKVESPEEFMSSLNEKDLVACDKPQLVVFGISLAGWNGIYMLFMLLINLLILYKMDFPVRKQIYEAK
jgi:disulfide bond formation protein DsbB